MIKTLTYIFFKIFCVFECCGIPRITTLNCVLFWQSPSLICLLAYILVTWFLELSERDFDHRGVVYGRYLSDKGRGGFQSMLSPSSTQEEMCHKTCLLFGMCNTSQTAANFATAQNKQNEQVTLNKMFAGVKSRIFTEGEVKHYYCLCLCNVHI